MRFKYALKPKQVTIQAIPECDSEWMGYRAESPYPQIKLTEPYLIFCANINHMHPDMLALLCIVTFYPFCRSSITFPEPVSVKFAKAVESLGIYDVKDGKYVRIDGNFNIMNINPNLQSYHSNSTNKALAYGGGLDSTAALCLFPELYIIHESRIKVSHNTQEVLEVYPDATESFMNDLERGWTKWKGRTFCIGSNNKDLCTPNGWSGWIACTATSILLATDLSLSAILLGSSIGSSNIKNGEIYSNPAPNMWLRLFAEIGLPVFSPISGLTEISLTKIISRTYPKWLSKITYCIKDNGRNCHKCWKCFRRQVIINYILHTELDSNREAISSKHDYSVNWKDYNHPTILNHLKNLAIDGGPSLQWALINSINHTTTKIAEWIIPFVQPYKEAFMKLESWIDKHHSMVLRIPPEYNSWIKGRIAKYIL